MPMCQVARGQRLLQSPDAVGLRLVRPAGRCVRAAALVRTAKFGISK